MPGYSSTDPRHPINKAQALHRALLSEYNVGDTLKVSEVKKLIRIGLDVHSHSSQAEYVRTMQDRGMLSESRVIPNTPGNQLECTLLAGDSLDGISKAFLELRVNRDSATT